MGDAAVNTISAASPRLRAGRRQQRGIVLFVALIVLIVMTLAGLALLRQMGVGTSIAGNVAFKENATSVADRGVEVARQWIKDNVALLPNNSVADGYYAVAGTEVDPTRFPWPAAKVVIEDFNGTGNTIRYLIQRLCDNPGSPNAPGQKCSDSISPNLGESKGGASYAEVPFTPDARPFYRVTTQVTGPRNTISYTQVLLN